MTASRIARWVATTMALAALAGVGAAGAFAASPLPPGLLDYRPVQSVRVLDRNGGLLRELRSRADGRSTPLRAEEIPPEVRAAFVAAEDKGFHAHLGLSPSAMLRAAWQDARARRWVAGGSTLTQQLARNLVPRPRTLLGKAQEALWALRLEAHLTKEEILTQYLNRVPFGNGAFGLEAAAQTYFGRSARNLSLAQAAALAAIPRGPSAYNPYRAPDRLSGRQRWILERMGRLGLVDPARASLAASEPLDLQDLELVFRAPHWVDFVAAHLDEWGLVGAAVVETTLDPELQAAVEDQVRQELSLLADRRVGSGAVLVVDNESGEVLAYVGSADFFDQPNQGQNDGVQMHRQPGSALKPFVYASAFAAGVTPATVLPDLETHFGASQGTYSPRNYDRRIHGPVRAREALASSFNVPAVRLAEMLGPERILETLRAAGFDSLTRDASFYGLGLALGDGEVSLWEAARAYSGLSRGGVVAPLVAVRSAWRADGAALAPLRAFARRRFTTPQAAALVADVLSDNAARARAFGLDSALRLDFPVAVKTGTSKGYADNWTIGFTHERTVAAWAGNFDGTPMIQVSGVTGAGPLFRRAMQRSMRQVAAAPLRGQVVLSRVDICPLSGERAGPSCPASMPEVFAPGTEPHHECAMHAKVASTLGEPLRRRCAALAGPGGRVTDLGPRYYDWARAEGLSEEPWLAAACAASPSAGPTEILYPRSGDEFLLLDDLPLADQAIPLRVRASAGEERLEVRQDGRPLLTLTPPFAGRVPAVAGEHRLSLHRPGEPRPLGEVRYRVRSGAL